MADQEQLDILKQGIDTWNQWREQQQGVRVDLCGADLSKAQLSGADLRRANLHYTSLSGANLRAANLCGATLRGASLVDADLCGADLSYAILFRASFIQSFVIDANFTHADLWSANLRSANFRQANWDIQLEGTEQDNFIITPPHKPTITVRNLKVAQFIYLLLNNTDIREVIDTIGQKGVLILGRFTPERKAVLDALREKLSTLNFLPIVFDFGRPATRDFTETIMKLAGLSCFIIAGITNPKSSPLELEATIPNYMTPFVPIIQENEQPFAMFTDLQNKYRDWVLDTLLYDTPSNLINVLERVIVKPALERQVELALIKAQILRTRHIKDYL